MLRNKEKDLLKTVAKLYYKQNLTQSEIAKICNVSRPKVSRLLAQARDLGIVKIFIADEIDTMDEIEKLLQEKYALKTVKIVNALEDDAPASANIMASEAALFIAGLLKPNDIIGFSWGYTIYAIAKAFPQLFLENVQIVQLEGNVDNAAKASRANEIIDLVSRKIKAEKAYVFPCPAMVDSKFIKEAMLKDRKIAQVMQKVTECNVAIVNLAVIGEDDCLYKAEYISAEQIELLKEHNAVGRIGCHYLNIEGKICCFDIDERTLGVGVEELKSKETVIACVNTVRKLPVLRAALKGNYINTLIIDYRTAVDLLN